MGYTSVLNLINAVTVTRETITSDGQGGTSVTTVTTTLGKAAIWQVGSGDVYLSDQTKAVSSHVLACRVADSVLSTDTVGYDGKTYQVAGEPDDVLQKGLVQVVPLQRVG